MFRKAEEKAVGKSLGNTQSYKMHQVYKHQIHTKALLAMSKVNKMYFCWMLLTEFPCCLQVYLAVIMEKLFQCNLHMLVHGFVFKNGCTVAIFLVYTNSPSTMSPEKCQIQVRNSNGF